MRPNASACVMDPSAAADPTRRPNSAPTRCRCMATQSPPLGFGADHSCRDRSSHSAKNCLRPMSCRSSARRIATMRLTLNWRAISPTQFSLWQILSQYARSRSDGTRNSAATSLQACSVGSSAGRRFRRSNTAAAPRGDPAAVALDPALSRPPGVGQLHRSAPTAPAWTGHSRPGARSERGLRHQGRQAVGRLRQQMDEAARAGGQRDGQMHSVEVAGELQLRHRDPAKPCGFVRRDGERREHRRA